MKSRYTTTARVQRFTPAAVRQHIQEDTEKRVDECAVHPEGISDRIAELDREWDIDRALFAWAGVFGLVTLSLGAFVRRPFLALSAVGYGFLLSYALTGFAPPALVMRRRGVRTATEIANERYALKALRGDFAQVESAAQSALSDDKQDGRGARAVMAAAE